MDRIGKLQKVLWKEVREQVKQLAPGLAKIIDELSPGNDHYLYRIEYPYGATILDKGVFQVPNGDSHLVPINHSTIPQKVQTDLGYSGTTPLGLILESSIEAFMRSGERIIPSSVVKAGHFISLWRALDEGTSFHAGRFWNVTSGTRSICMVPKITDASSYKVLKNKFSLKLPIPQKLNGHWELFRHIVNHANFQQPWKSTLLFFPKKWLENKKDAAWTNFYHFLLNAVWQTSRFRRNQFVFDFVFSLAQENRNLRPNPYLADTVRHLVAIGNGAVPGFTVAVDNSAAPVTGLQQVCLEDYGLKKYAPVIMHTHHFSPSEQRAIYYSFQIPTTMIFSPKSRKLSSAMAELQEVKYIMEILLSEILRGNLEVENTPLFELAQNIRYNFYHSEKDKIGEIALAREIANIDSHFTRCLINGDSYTFPEFAPFFRGCIAISNTS